MISTHPSTNKYKNIQENNVVALAIGWSFKDSFLQIKGSAYIVNRTSGYEEKEKYFYAENPEAEKFKTPDLIFIEIKPKWIRFNDTSVMPPKTEEITL